MRRAVIVAGLCLLPVLAGAQGASPAVAPTPDHPLDPSAAAVWELLATKLKKERDQLEWDVAALRAAVDKARKAWEAAAKELTQLKASKPAPAAPAEPPDGR
jgi:hypothetical protein